jgi:dolichol-phosphate mannosyltransferase
MSGFFALRVDVLDPAVRRLSNLGFKILLDLVASSPVPLRIKEVPYEFRNRHAGESKLDSQAMWDYLMLLLDKLVGHVVPVRFVAFGLVGGVGVLLHFAVLTALFRVAGLSFTVGQSAATAVAMLSNFMLNNALTFRDMRLKGWKWLKGLASFVLVCSLGAVSNIGIASYLFGRNGMWAVAALAGIAIGAVWNYAMSSMYTWNKKKS